VPLVVAGFVPFSRNEHVLFKALVNLDKKNKQ
jgi:hypothetical protein